MAPNDAPPLIAEPRPGSKPDPNEGLKSLSMSDCRQNWARRLMV